MIHLKHAFWHGSSNDLQNYHYFGRSYLWTQHIGPYAVRTWTDKDGKPIVTGWFTKED